ncbi:MAG TPA: bifunctional precorrin-2 dehydrogenase/sirohydrochlorin ferrochelatase [Polyangiaceae bacterium]|nr:bifunctional precorrin-2 dehydrogenase/sirohydrochlorin ferrochelatase [Polyangiaceae bacterium]
MRDESAADLLPLFLRLGDKLALVVGGGAVAERKIASLLDVGARVRVVAPDASDEVKRLAREGRVEWRERAFEDADVEGAWLVYTATSSPEVQRSVATAAEARRVFCVAVDDPPNASAYSAAVVRRPPMVVAISSSGAAPALTRLLREVIEHVLPAEEWIRRAEELRAQWLRDGTPMGDRFAQLVREIARGRE